MTKRVRIERDESMERPDDDGQMPVVFIPYMNAHGWSMAAHGAEYLPDEGQLHHARGYLGWEDTIRWLNIFVGKVMLTHEHVNRDGVYVEVASQAWLDAMSVGDWKPDLTDYEGSTFKHYLEGEVYLLIPEVLTKWTAEDGRERVEWEEDPGLFAVSGYYGKEHTLDAAKEEFYDEEFVVVDEDGTILFGEED